MPRPRTGTGNADAVDATGFCDEITEGVADGNGVADETAEGVSEVATADDWPGVEAAAPETLP